MSIFRVFICACLITFPIVANAQAVAKDGGAGVDEVESVKQPPVSTATPKQRTKPEFNPDEYQSLVFTHWEHVAIQDARNSRGKTRSVSEAELMLDLNKRDDKSEKVKPPPEEREIRLSGIVYHDSKDWTLWLNEQRVTPTAIPEEVMDLKVYKTYIEFRWFDDWTNQIFPIRLRPHQRFNIDSRIFLPG